jgi:hypothetical protein
MDLIHILRDRLPQINNYPYLNIINKMSEISFQSNTIANGMVHQIMSNVETEVLTK